MDEEGPPPRKGMDEGTTIGILILIGLAVIAYFYLPRLLGGRPGSHAPSPEMMAVHVINLTMFSYANDHGMAYPTGKSSTEVFQKLLDEGYVTDPATFYFPMPGKTKPTSNKLKPDNVCWDVTISVTDKDSDDVPTVFATGYRMIYAPGGRAIPLVVGPVKFPGLHVAYKNMSAMFRVDDGSPDHIVLNVIGPGFTSGGKTYQQLTPDGILPP